MEDTDLKWRKSSYSGGNGGSCVELADHAGQVLVRDTNNRTGPVLAVTASAWRELLDRVRLDSAS